MGYRSIARPLPTRPTQTENERDILIIRAPSGIRSHDPSVRGSQDITFLIWRGHFDWPAQELEFGY
jgi:hypothetical protein